MGAGRRLLSRCSPTPATSSLAAIAHGLARAGTRLGRRRRARARARGRRGRDGEPHPIVARRSRTSERALDALLETVDEPLVSANGRRPDRACGDAGRHLDAYRAALGRGTLEDARSSSRTSMRRFPPRPRARLGRPAARHAGARRGVRALGVRAAELGVDWLSALPRRRGRRRARLARRPRTPGGRGRRATSRSSSSRVPADARRSRCPSAGRRASSTGSRSTVDVDGIAGALEDAIGRLARRRPRGALGRGRALRPRRGEELPEVTLVLAPPDADKTWSRSNRLLRKARRRGRRGGRDRHRERENGQSPATAEQLTVCWTRGRART